MITRCVRLYQITPTVRTVCNIHLHRFKTQHLSYSQSKRTPTSKMSEESTEKLVKEGAAEVFLPTSVFYNPVQEFNRDLTIAVISQFAKEYIKQSVQKAKSKAGNEELQESDQPSPSDIPDLKAGRYCDNGVSILEGLAASGLRSIRFALEIPGVKSIIANDFDQGAVELIRKNSAQNKVEELVQASHADAAMLMYQHRSPENQFDVIDLDPYGTPVPFLDAAVQAVKSGGLLCITCTDLAILCGNSPEACHAKYGSFPLRSKFCHEQALRIALRCIEAHANKYNRSIEPLISVTVDFYLRVFVRVHTGAHRAKESVTKLSNVYYCKGCGSYTMQPLATRKPARGKGNFVYLAGASPDCSNTCVHCSSQLYLGGPVWSHPLHDVDFIGRVLDSVSGGEGRFQTEKRIMGVLSMAQEELQDVPFYYVADELYRVIHVTPPNIMQMRSAILHAGYRISFSHAEKNSLKTDAPPEVIWDILRCWAKKNPVSEKRLKEDIPARTILSKEPTLEADFSLHPSANPESRKKGLLRWQANPQRDWGPQIRASTGPRDTLDERRLRGVAKKMERKRKIQEQEETEKKTKTEEMEET